MNGRIQRRIPRNMVSRRPRPPPPVRSLDAPLPQPMSAGIGARLARARARGLVQRVTQIEDKMEPQREVPRAVDTEFDMSAPDRPARAPHTYVAPPPVARIPEAQPVISAPRGAVLPMARLQNRGYTVRTRHSPMRDRPDAPDESGEPVGRTERVANHRVRDPPPMRATPRGPPARAQMPLATADDMSRAVADGPPRPSARAAVRPGTSAVRQQAVVPAVSRGSTARQTAAPAPAPVKRSTPVPLKAAVSAPPPSPAPPAMADAPAATPVRRSTPVARVIPPAARAAPPTAPSAAPRALPPTAPRAPPAPGSRASARLVAHGVPQTSRQAAVRQAPTGGRPSGASQRGQRAPQNKQKGASRG
jgi:hypothetical protein